MQKLNLPPTLDVPKITLSGTVEGTVKAWFQHIAEGVQEIRVAPGVRYATKVYGQSISRNAVIAGIFSTFSQLDRLTKDIALALWECSRGRNLVVRAWEHAVTLPFRRDGLQFTFPVPTIIIERGVPVFLCVQARKTPPFSIEEYSFFGSMLRLGIQRTVHPDADGEICDLSAPAKGMSRKPSVFRLSNIKLVGEQEVNDRLAILAEAYDRLKLMKLPEPKERKKSPSDQGDFGF